MAAQPRTTLRLSDLANRKPTTFEITPDAGSRAQIAADLGIVGIKKLRFAGQISPTGKRDWDLTADLGATVVQDCVVTLDPVTTRLDEQVHRIYAADFEISDAAEVEMPEDERVEPLPDAIDLMAVMSETLSLALPPFPRKDGASLDPVIHTEPGKEAMTDDDAKPFAGLGALRAALEKKDADDLS